MRYKPVLTPLAVRLRARRAELGFTQGHIASLLSVTPQQYSKYERGENELKSGQLLILAEALKLDLEEMGLGHSRGPDLHPIVSDPEINTLIEAWQRISSGDVRKSLLTTIAAIAKNEDG